ncbi:hypothetical protein CFC21_047949 [Triticum aestivum]|uniref:serine C-palmitoyltransferase n=2 Tax=Triticum aestivum TaxID=4565 RepID=A0A3B6GV87_WHEAT|nr:hypothetical protein CFC21_047949 [Triticum aestivum]
MAQWDTLVDGALASLAARRLLFNTRLIALAPPPAPSETRFTGPGPWDRATVEIQVDRTSIRQWLAANGEVSSQEEDEANRELILFSGNDYTCLRASPAVGPQGRIKIAAQEYGMGPRGSSLICGYTTYHKLVQESLAELQKKEETTQGPYSSPIGVLLKSRINAEDERIAIFSDALNHASTVDGIRLVERQHQAVAFVYKHCDMSHLDFLLSSCSMKKKVVVTYRQAHGTLLCGENGGGIPELFGCDDDIDICVGSLSKGVGCQGGKTSTRWKRLILSRGRSFIFSTALPLPVVASVHVIWEHVQYFASLTKLNVTSPIIVILVGSEEAAVKAHRHLLRSGFLVQPIRPPVVPPNSSRLRITLSSAHTSDDIRRLVDALAPWLLAQHVEQGCASVSRL